MDRKKSKEMRASIRSMRPRNAERSKAFSFILLCASLLTFGDSIVAASFLFFFLFFSSVAKKKGYFFLEVWKNCLAFFFLEKKNQSEKMELIQRLREDFLSKHVDEEALWRCRQREYEAYGLADAEGALPKVLLYDLPISVNWMQNLHGSVSSSSKAKRRLGDDWLPFGRNKPLRKDDLDTSWVSKEELNPLNDACTSFARALLPASDGPRHLRPERLPSLQQVRSHTIAAQPAAAHVQGGRGAPVRDGRVSAELPVEQRAMGFRYLQKHGALNISDFDFEIIRKQKVADPGETHAMILETYAVLLGLQKAMAVEVRLRQTGKRMHRLMNTRWEAQQVQDELKGRLQAVVDKLPDGHSLAGASVDTVFLSDVVPPEERERWGRYAARNGEWHPPRRDSVFIFSCGAEKRCVESARDVFEALGIPNVSNEYSSPFYSTCNTYIGEDVFDERNHDEKKSTLFHLSRIKHAFVFYYTDRHGKKRCDRLGGEMIDLSMTDERDEFKPWMQHRAETFYQASLYQEYAILGVPQKIYSLSPHGFLLDLEKMIHHEINRAYKALKYEKRILRYCVFLVIVVMGPGTEGTLIKKLDALKALVRHTAAPMHFIGTRLHTGIPAVDHFAERERTTLRKMSVQTPEQGQAIFKYVSTIHTHMGKVVSLVAEQDRQPSALRIQYTEIQNLRRHTRV